MVIKIAATQLGILLFSHRVPERYERCTVLNTKSERVIQIEPPVLVLGTSGLPNQLGIKFQGFMINT